MFNASGPLPKIKYEPGRYQNIGMIAGGSGMCCSIAYIFNSIYSVLWSCQTNTFITTQTYYSNIGITPMAQVIEEVTRNPNDKTNITLLFANIGPHDILLREKFDAIAATHPNFKPVYIVESNAESGMITGRINADLLKKYLPKPDPSNQILVCGPQGMMAAISGTKAKDFSQGELDGLLKQLGYTKDNVYKF